MSLADHIAWINGPAPRHEDKQWEWLEAQPAGTLLRVRNARRLPPDQMVNAPWETWCKLAKLGDEASRHLEGCWVNLQDGTVLHFSWLVDRIFPPRKLRKVLDTESDLQYTLHC